MTNTKTQNTNIEKSHEELKATFTEKLSTWEEMDSKKQKLEKFVKSQKLSIIDDTRTEDISKSLNKLYAKKHVGNAVVLQTEADRHFETHDNIVEEIKDDDTLNEYYATLKANLDKYTKGWQQRQTERKGKLETAETIIPNIDQISELFVSLESLHSKSKDAIKACIEALSIKFLNDDLFNACKTETLSRVKIAEANFNTELDHTKDITHQTLAKYFVGEFECSTDHKKILISTANLKTLQDFNEEVNRYYDKDIPSHEKLTTTRKDATKETYDRVVDLQNDMTDITGAVEKEKRTPEKGDFSFVLDYDSYSTQLSKHAKATFKKGIIKIINQKAFHDADLSLEDVQGYLNQELNEFCPKTTWKIGTAKEFLFGRAKEDQMYCDFKDSVVGELNSQPISTHDEM